MVSRWAIVAVLAWGVCGCAVTLKPPGVVLEHRYDTPKVKTVIVMQCDQQRIFPFVAGRTVEDNTVIIVINRCFTA